MRKALVTPTVLLMKFADLVTGAQRGSWIAATGDIETIRRQADADGWSEVPVRLGDQPVFVLKPVQPGSAHPGP
jgi:hypothetical protein